MKSISDGSHERWMGKNVVDGESIQEAIKHDPRIIHVVTNSIL